MGEKMREQVKNLKTRNLILEEEVEKMKHETDESRWLKLDLEANHQKIQDLQAKLAAKNKEPEREIQHKNNDLENNYEELVKKYHKLQRVNQDLEAINKKLTKSPEPVASPPPVPLSSWLSTGGRTCSITWNTNDKVFSKIDNFGVKVKKMRTGSLDEDLTCKYLFGEASTDFYFEVKLEKNMKQTSIGMATADWLAHEEDYS